MKVKFAVDQAVEAEVELYNFFNLGVIRGCVIKATPRPGRFTPGKETRCALYMRFGVPQGWCGKSRPNRDSIPGRQARGNRYTF